MSFCRFRAGAALAALALILAARWANAQELAVPLENQTAIAVTIYNDNLALVKDKRRVELPAAHIKTVGTHTVSVRLHPEVAAPITVEVTAES